MRSGLPALFQSIPVASAVCRAETLSAEAATYRQDVVSLGWEDRIKTRARRRSDSGFEFATTLPRGTVLRDGDCFVFVTPLVVVRVLERAEPVLVVRPRTSQQWALYAYHIGNSHQPVMVADDGIVCPDGPGIEDVLKHYGVPFVREVRAFTPVGQVPDHRHQRTP